MSIAVLRKKVRDRISKRKISVEDYEEYVFYLAVAAESGGRA